MSAMMLSTSRMVVTRGAAARAPRLPARCVRARASAGKNQQAHTAVSEDVSLLLFKAALDDAAKGKRVGLAATAFTSPLLLVAQDAMAKDWNLGILEGRTGALVHPAIMGFFFGASLYAGYLGYQWRRVRTLGDEIKTLKDAQPAVAEGAAAVPTEADAKISALAEERKELIAGGFRDRHTSWGNLLLALGVLIAIEGPVNTYIRTGKLFPGPHLYAGAGIVVLWAAAASLTPQMQKGNDTARSLHIALNCVNLGLFAWQVPTGLEIVGKVFEFTKWP